jgi:hypothetical protein
LLKTAAKEICLSKRTFREPENLTRFSIDRSPGIATLELLIACSITRLSESSLQAAKVAPSLVFVAT